MGRRNQASSPSQARGSVSGPWLCLKANDGDPDAAGKREVIPTASSSRSTHALLPQRCYEYLPICRVRPGCLRARGTAQASSRLEPWYQDDESQDCSWITIAAASICWAFTLLFARHYAKHFVQISCKLQDNPVRQDSIISSLLQKRTLEAHSVMGPLTSWAVWRQGLTPVSLASFPSLFTSPHTISQSHTHILEKTEPVRNKHKNQSRTAVF